MKITKDNTYTYIEIEHGTIEEYAELCKHIEEKINNDENNPYYGQQLFRLLLETIDDEIYLIIQVYEPGHNSGTLHKTPLGYGKFKGIKIVYTKATMFIDNNI